MRPVTKLQRAALELPKVNRPHLVIPRYPEGSRTQPTGNLSKLRAADAFREWEQWLSPREMVTGPQVYLVHSLPGLTRFQYNNATLLKRT